MPACAQESFLGEEPQLLSGLQRAGPKLRKPRGHEGQLLPIASPCGTRRHTAHAPALLFRKTREGFILSTYLKEKVTERAESDVPSSAPAALPEPRAPPWSALLHGRRRPEQLGLVCCFYRCICTSREQLGLDPGRRKGIQRTRWWQRARATRTPPQAHGGLTDLGCSRADAAQPAHCQGHPQGDCRCAGDGRTAARGAAPIHPLCLCPLCCCGRRSQSQVGERWLMEA